MNRKDFDVETIAVHAGRDDLAALGVHAPPIDLSTTNPLLDIESGGDSYEVLSSGGTPPENGSFVYGRLWNPTVARFERGLAKLEHAEESVAFASGMAALTAAITALCVKTRKTHIVAVRPLYGGSDFLLTSELLGTQVTYCDTSEIESSVRGDTGLIIIETPANPTLDLVDIEGVVAQSHGVPVLVDNTFATPVLQNPLDHGAALSLHSATKYIGGHGDVVAGVIACAAEIASQLRSVRAITGSLLHPLAAYLLHRGLPTLPLRVRAQQETAIQVAAWLRDRPEIAQVYYPGYQDDPENLIGTQLRGTGSMLSVRMAGGFEAASSLTSTLGVFTHAVSLGGVDSLIQHPAALTHRPVTGDAKPDAGLVRISIGLESSDDLIADLEAALSTLSTE